MFISFRGWRKKKWLLSKNASGRKKSADWKILQQKVEFTECTEHMHDERLLKMRQMEVTAKKFTPYIAISVFPFTSLGCVCVSMKDHTQSHEAATCFCVSNRNGQTRKQTVPCLSADFQCLDHNSCAFVRLKRKTHRKKWHQTQSTRLWLISYIMCFLCFVPSFFYSSK